MVISRSSVVAGGVTEAVVDRLEVVEVDEQHAVATGAPRAGHRVAEPVAEQGSVGQAGQRVVERLVGQLLLELVPLGDVVTGDHEAHQVLVDHLGDHDVDVAGVPVLVVQPDLAADGAAALREADQVARGVPVGWVDDVEPVHAEQLGRRQADDRLDRRCHVHDRQVVVEDAG